MKLRELKLEVSQALLEVYPSEEVASFFVLLSEAYLNMSRLELALNTEVVVSEAVSEKFRNAVVRLKAFEPIQYIIGTTEFYSLPFNVTKATLIPRPETEELVDWILNDIPKKENWEGSVLDIGTGSGCIAISLAKNLPKSSVSALDFSEEALKIAKQNAELNGVSVDFSTQNILTVATLPKQYSVIVSNPPYVRELEKKEMQQNVLRHEPDSALFVSDADPLVFYRRIATLAKQHLYKDGLLYFEINEYLGNELVTMLTEMDYKNVTLKKDIFGRDRMIKCKTNE
ncbi:peptide chain release factor N(5)-glutamine methyltransferase [Ulvibacter litoralis]|uniref:Release factor glutamine methyltransferase n=1 Tax=Ulvibacter litoralis TaxID=227084 RepID=A0A1G7EL88_9FLAO|nr:peptide chain release factor N(5)-glutamine methyltransferase [Ulvibacter litoralis]GHC54642.1 release factor glutamine methyltransferase [Ulvibacter litoralis]SDE64483.1 release factor glutamine methyltransferase [Ulvibacter litoralis]